MRVYRVKRRVCGLKITHIGSILEEKTNPELGSCTIFIEKNHAGRRILKENDVNG